MRYAWVIAVVIPLFAFRGSAQAEVRIDKLRCEYLTDPMGLDAAKPRLSWILLSDQRGQRQTAYEVLVASSPEILARDEGDLWTTGRVASDQTCQVVYAGKPPISRQACFWKVRVYDRDGKPGDWSKPARWEMGLLVPRDWKAAWIEADLTAGSDANDSLAGAKWIWRAEPGVDLSRSAPPGERFFRRHLALKPGKTPQSARLILSVDDQFTLYVNGKQAGHLAEVDGWKRPQRFDLLPLLTEGDNVIAVAATNIASVAGVIAKVVVQYPGEKPDVIVSDRHWKSSETAPHGWTRTDFNDADWTDSFEVAALGEGLWGKLADGPGSGPVPVLRKSFTLPEKTVRSARLYATALGLYVFHLNGRRVGDIVLAPEWTDYRKRARYQVYDVASLIKPGQNALAALLADGWYCGHIGNGGYQFFGKSPALLAQLEITYSDGSAERIVTDASWKIHASPILASDFMLGENYDATKEVSGWDEAGLDDGGWLAAKVRTEPQRAIEGQVTQPVRETGQLPAKTVTEPKPGRWTFDLGQNMVGVVRLKVSARAGTKLTLRHAEMLNPDGTIYTKNLRSAVSIDRCVCKGGGEVWQPAFTFHGFRYVELTGLPDKPGLDTVTGIVIGSDLPQAGSFSCSDPRINQLMSNIRWGQRGNYLSVPTDCPQRDERLGWMGDAQVFVPTATCNADVAAFFSKWLVDVDDGQSREGAFSDVSPNTMGGGGVPAWGDAGVICPWTIYRVYGDRRILERHLPHMARWVEYCRRQSTNLIRDKFRGNDYGNWLSIGANTPKELIGTAYFAYSTSLVARSFRAVGNKVEAERYERLFHEIKAAFNKRYVAADGRIKGNTQCCYAMALKFDLLPDALKAKAAAYLDEDIKRRGWRLSTGFVGVGCLMPALTQNGKVDTAYRLLMQDAFPSWLFSVKHGATTIWERWDGWTPDRGFQDPGMNSFNHYSLGSCGEWIYDTVAGIGLDSEIPGYRHIILRPRAGGGLTTVSAAYDSIHGPISSQWSLSHGKFSLNVSLPPNTTATVFVPAADAAQVTESGKPAAEAEGVKFLRTEGGEAVFELQSGSYRFVAGGT
jgi:alpha-L-rhamnosidase